MNRVGESYIERTFCRKVRERGGIADKFVSPGRAGVPDRIVLLPGGWTFFVEFKAPGRKATPLQKKRHAELEALGFRVFIVDNLEDANKLLERLFKLCER